MENEPRCRHCGSTEIDHDPSRGDAVCTNCGSVLEESIIVSEVQFAQDSHGASRAIGQLVTAEGNGGLGFNLGNSYGLSKESRAVTLHNARKKITDLSRKLVLSDHCIDMAHNFYKMALTRRLTQGRKNTHIVAACVYLVCRQQETPHMLLDISDILQVNVYELGKTYLKLQTELCINTPSTDPTLYILRFAHQLGFEDKIQDVALAASRLVQRMKRDWMHTGRRPSGLCGAALLVAARMHNFNRSVNDIIKVVKVGQATIRKRLNEFSDTPSSRLTLDQFMTIDLEEEQDPPAFKAARKKKGADVEESRIKEVEQEVYKLQKEIEQALEKFNEKKLTSLLKSSVFPEAINDKSIMGQFITDSTFNAIVGLLNTENNTGENPIIQNNLADEVIPVSVVDYNEVPIINPETFNKDLENFDISKGLDATDIRDGDIDSYVLSSNEIRSKSKYWFDINKNYLKEQRIKKEKRLREEENNKKEPKKKRQRHKREPLQAQTTGEAIEKILQQKKISLKLDYNVLRNLNAEKGSEEMTETKASIVNLTDNNMGGSKEKPIRRKNPKIKPQPIIPNEIRTGISELVKKAQSQKSKSKLSDDEDVEMAPHSDQLSNDVIIVENEPTSSMNEKIINQDQSNDHHEMDYNSQDELDEDDDDEIDHSQMSAAQLLGYGCNNNEFDDYDFD